jgi:hypothetical protein
VASNLARRLGGVLRGEQERTLGRQAVRAGFLTEKELSDLVARAAADPESIVSAVEAVLAAKGVASEQIRRLRDEVDREDFALFRPDRRLPDEAEAVAGDAERRIAEFILVSRLGRGGIGEVWKAWDTRLGRWVAIKLPMRGPDDEAAGRRFTREALAAARLSHPNIVSIYRVAEEKGRPFIVMQYVEGPTLAKVRPPLRGALEILRAVAWAVQHAHEQGVVHRDLKPANIMIGPDGRPFVLDFGLAHLQEVTRLQSRDGTVAGTAAYMSPEQARGEPAARAPATDLYALGATLYELVAGRPPYEGTSFADTLEKVLYREPPRPRAVDPAIPRDVETIILRAMDKDPARRYASAKDLATDLERFLQDRPIQATRDTIARAVGRRVRKHTAALTVIGASVVVAIGALILAAFEAQRTEHLRKEQESRLRAIRDLTQVSLEAVLELRRAGANEKMSEFLPRMESSYREAVSSLPDVAEIDHLYGRVQRALMNDARALELAEGALSKDPDYAPALYEKIILSSREFGRTLGRARTRAAALPPGPVTPDSARRAAPASVEGWARGRGGRARPTRWRRAGSSRSTGETRRRLADCWRRRSRRTRISRRPGRRWRGRGW